jgi:transcriptional repressor NrdR
VVKGERSIVRCPWCGHAEDKVVDSRGADAGSAIRRRRECLKCSRRYTTFERVEELGLFVIKRDGSKEPYDREKVVLGIAKAMKNRSPSDPEVQRIAAAVEQALRRKGPRVTSQEVGLEVLDQLRKADPVAYLRFVSVYKDFQEVTDFERELGLLLQKKEPAKSRAKRSSR